MKKSLMNKVVEQIKEAGFGYAIVKNALEEGEVMVTSEVWDDEKQYAIDYYGEFRGGYPWVHEKLEAIAKKNGCYWEWEHPGAVSLGEL